MNLNPASIIKTDVLIIGGGGAALRAAIEARENGVDVLLVSQSRAGYGSNTTISGGAFAAVLSPAKARGDSPDSCELHLQDTITGGYFINDQTLATAMVNGAEQQVEDLLQLGVRYTNMKDSPWIALSMDPGHSQFRMVYGQNAYGTDFTFPLRQCAIEKGASLLDGVLITRLLKHKGEVAGAMGVDSKGQVYAFAAAAVILASGGLGKVYSHSDNVAGATGDGYAVAYKAGAVLQDMEFVQFYPTSTGRGTPAVFYECLLLTTGGKLVNHLGEDIISKHNLSNPMLLTRDRLSLAIAREMINSHDLESRITLDLTEVSEERWEMLQPILPRAALHGERRFLVAPTSHTHLGGVKINEKAETSMPGLYAAGEVCAGIHGANRLTGNALTEIWVFGTIAGREAARRAKEKNARMPPAGAIADGTGELQEMTSRQGGERTEMLCHLLQETMWQRAGIMRDAGGLKQALEEIASLRERYHLVSVADGRRLHLTVKLGNMLTASEMICHSALLRSESRGTHYRQDYPDQNDSEWLCNTLLKEKDNCMTLRTRPVRFTRLSP